MMRFVIVCFVAFSFNFTAFARADLTPDEARAQYRLARPKLEEIWDAPARYTFKNTIKRWDFPPEMTGKVQPENHFQFDIFGQKGRWRIDTIIDQGNGPAAKHVVVSTKDKQFSVMKKPGERVYTTLNTEGQSRLFAESEKTIAGLCEVAFVLPTRVDVSEILLSPDYTIEVIPDTDTQPDAEPTRRARTVTCAFDRIQKAKPGEKVSRLHFESGRIRFLTDQDWAIDRYLLRSNTGLNLEGHVEYQQIKGVNSRTILKRVEFTSTETKSSLKTSDVIEAVSIVPGSISDDVFSLSEFQSEDRKAEPKNLDIKQSEGWNYTALLIGLGVILIVVAITVRLLTQRKPLL